jgi:hypothetical protein
VPVKGVRVQIPPSAPFFMEAELFLAPFFVTKNFFASVIY